MLEKNASASIDAASFEAALHETANMMKNNNVSDRGHGGIDGKYMN